MKIVSVTRRKLKDGTILGVIKVSIPGKKKLYSVGYDKIPGEGWNQWRQSTQSGVGTEVLRFTARTAEFLTSDLSEHGL